MKRHCAKVKSLISNMVLSKNDESINLMFLQFKRTFKLFNLIKIY
jgi:hypothetical protein